MTSEFAVEQLLRGPVSGLGLVLEGVRVTPAGRRRVVRVTLDRDLGEVSEMVEAAPPLTLDEVAEATSVIGDQLEGSGLLGEQPYTLEVSSPGVSRPLTSPEHFLRNVTRLLTVVTNEGEAIGRLLRADRNGITLELPPTKREPARRVDLAHAEITSAKVQVEFARPAASPDETTTAKDA